MCHDSEEILKEEREERWNEGARHHNTLDRAGQVTLTCPTVEEEVRCGGGGAKVEKGEE